MCAVRHERGFTLVEMMIAVAIVAIIAMLAVPGVRSYRLREDTRANAQMLAGVLTEARSRAQKEGNPTFVLFNQPGIPEAQAGQIAMVVSDLDGSGTVTAGDTFRSYFPKPGSSSDITGYGLGPTPPFSTAPVAPNDPAGGTLAGVANGSTFPLDPTTGVPAVGFSTGGIPVQLVSPPNWTDFGTGAGGYYVTDNNGAVYAAVMLPLGGVRVYTLDGANATWR